MSATPSDTPTLSAHQRRRRLVLLGAVPAIALVVITVLYLAGGRYVETENAYVKADKVAIGIEVAGTVKEVLVRENQTVVPGQPLFRLDTAGFEVARAKADAKLAQVRTDLAALRASYREKQAEIVAARTRQTFAQREQQRQADLVARHFVSSSSFDGAKEGADLARAQIAALEQDLKRIAEALGGSVDAPVEKHPAYRAAQAELAQAELDLRHTEVRAALPGTVSKPPKPGQYLAPGATTMALVVSGKLWVEANFTETDLTYVHPGQNVVIHVDTFPDAHWKGVVESLSPATGAEFSVIPAQNASGNWVKIAQRVPIHIALAADNGQPPLRAGLSAVVEIDTGHRRHLLGVSL